MGYWGKGERGRGQAEGGRWTGEGSKEPNFQIFYFFFYKENCSYGLKIINCLEVSAPFPVYLWQEITISLPDPPQQHLLLSTASLFSWSLPTASSAVPIYIVE